jgi:hypothetical protein
MGAGEILLLSFCPSFLQERPDPHGKSFFFREQKVVYRVKDGTEEKIFDAPVSSTGQALEWLVPPLGGFPHPGQGGEQMDYGYCSNVSWGKRSETEADGVPCIWEPDKSSKEYRKNWARLIQKTYEVDPLTRPKACPEPVEGCWGIMRVISLIEDREVIKAILKHLGLWLVRAKPTPKAHAPLP